MAFPSVASVTQTAFNTSAASHPVSMPATVAAGDDLVVLFQSESPVGVTTPSGWTHVDTTPGGTGFVYSKKAAGSEGGTTVDFVTASGRRAVAECYRITGGDPSIPVESANASNVTNPPALTPSWGALDTLWIAVGVRGGSTLTAHTAAPTNYGGLSSIGLAAGTAFLDTAHRALNAASENPLTFTGGGGTLTSGGTFTVGVAPATFVPGGSDAPVDIEVAATGGGAGNQNQGGADAPVEVEVAATGGGFRVQPIPTATTWRDRIRLVVEVGRRGASVGESVWDESEWADESTLDPATWSGLEPTWTVLGHCDVVELSVRRGRFAGTDRFAAGTATALLSFPVESGAWSLRPNPPVMLGDELRLTAAVDGGAVIPLWRGLVRDVVDEWDPQTPALLGVRVQMVDRFADLAAVNLAPLETPVGADELTGDRLARILTAAEIDLYYADLAPGVVELQATSLSRNMLDEAQISVESEVGQLYTARDGRITFRGRDWRTLPRSAAPRLVWTNVDPVPDAVPPDVCPVEFRSGQNTDLVANQVTRARAGGSAITVRDESSVVTYGLRTNRRLDMICVSDVDVEYAAEAYLAERSTRIDAVGPLSAVLDQYAPGAQLEALVDLELLDRNDIRWTDRAGAPVELSTHVQSVAHTIRADLWRVTVGVWAYQEEPET